MVSSETKNATSPAIASISNAPVGIAKAPSLAYLINSTPLSRLAEAITGIAAKNENSAAVGRGIPKKAQGPMAISSLKEKKLRQGYANFRRNISKTAFWTTKTGF